MGNQQVLLPLGVDLHFVFSLVVVVVGFKNFDLLKDWGKELQHGICWRVPKSKMPRARWSTRHKMKHSSDINHEIDCVLFESKSRHHPLKAQASAGMLHCFSYHFVMLLLRCSPCRINANLLLSS